MFRCYSAVLILLVLGALIVVAHVVSVSSLLCLVGLLVELNKSIQVLTSEGRMISFSIPCCHRSSGNILFLFLHEVIYWNTDN